VLGDRIQPVDPGIVCEALVIAGDDALGLRLAQVFQGKKTQVAVQQQIFPGYALLRINHQRLNQADLFDRRPDGPEPLDVVLGSLYQPRRQNVGERQSDL
jgi:hypothetical protein